MKECAYCGTQNMDDAGSCTSCGAASFVAPPAAARPVYGQPVQPPPVYGKPVPPVYAGQAAPQATPKKKKKKPFYKRIWVYLLLAVLLFLVWIYRLGADAGDTGEPPAPPAQEATIPPAPTQGTPGGASTDATPEAGKPTPPPASTTPEAGKPAQGGIAGQAEGLK